MTTADLAAVVVASLLGSFVKSITGLGFPLVAIPILSLFIDVETAIVVIAIPNVVANALLGLHAAAARHETRDLPILTGVAVIGAVFGTFVLVSVSERVLLFLLAGTIALFIVHFIRTPQLQLTAATTRRWSPVAGTVAGLSHGALGISGPIVAMWFHGYRLTKDAYVFSVTMLFLVPGLTQVVVLSTRGEFDRERLGAAGLSLLASLVVMPLGTRLRSRLEGPAFERVVLALLSVSAVSLIGRGVG